MSTPLTLLEIVQTACDELGLPRPSTVIGSDDPQVRQLLSLVNRDGIELFKSHEWSALTGLQVIRPGASDITVTGDVLVNNRLVTNLSSTTGLVAGVMAVTGTGMPTAQRLDTIRDATSVFMVEPATSTKIGATLTFCRDTFGIATDFDRFIPHTWWDRTNHWMLIGPTSPQFDEWQQSGVVTTGPRRHWRQIGKMPTNFRIWPPPFGMTVQSILTFEYVSDGWILDVDGTTKKRFTKDTDTAVFDEEMMILGVKWRMWQIKGFEYGAMQQEYNDFVAREKAHDGGMPDLAMGRRRFPYLLTAANVQDGFFPGS